MHLEQIGRDLLGFGLKEKECFMKNDRIALNGDPDVVPHE